VKQTKDLQKIPLFSQNKEQTSEKKTSKFSYFLALSKMANEYRRPSCPTPFKLPLTFAIYLPVVLSRLYRVLLQW